MKKQLCIVLSIFVCLALLTTACGSPKQSDASDASQQTGSTDVQATASTASTETTAEMKDVSLKFWFYPMIVGLNGEADGKPDDWVNDRIKRFKEIYPHVTVEAEMLNWQGGTEKIDVSVASGNAPDLAYSINNFGGVTKYGKLGALEPVDPFFTEEDWNDYAPAVKSAIRYGDKHYMFPWLTLVSAIAVNMDIFNERNAANLLPLDRDLRDWTFDEFLAAAKAVTFSRSGGSKPDVYGYGAWGKDGVFYNFLFSPLNGGSILDEQFVNYTFNSKESVEGLQFFTDLVNVHKVIPEGAVGLSGTNVTEMFLQSKVAMLPSASGMELSVNQTEKPFEVQYVAFPHGPNAQTTSWNNVGGFMFFKQTDEYKKKMVAEFGKFVTNAENSQIVKYAGSFAARKSAGNIHGEEDKNMAYFYKLSDYGNSAFSRSFGLAPVADWETAVQAMMLKAKTPQQVADEMGKIITEALKE